MSSGETLDPRFIESTLDRSTAIHRSCIVGDNFLRGASRVVCAILELSTGDSRGYRAALSEVTQEIAAINRTLAPPLRISWSRVLILNQDQHIPVTRKGAVFRKKLEEEFGDQLEAQLSLTLKRSPASSPASLCKADSNNGSETSHTDETVAISLLEIVSEGLQIEQRVLKENSSCTFAEVS